MLKINKHHQRRLFYIGLVAVCLSTATALILFALKQNINVFLTPSEVYAAKNITQYQFRLGGMVKTGSVKRNKTSLEVNFIVTDFKKEIPIRYVGILPDLFREGKGVIAEGQLSPQGTFNASMVLAKHDENYMPPSMYKKIKEKQ